MSETQGAAILLVEDEESLAIGLEFNLRAEGYNVVRAGDGRKALECFENGKFDLIILDIMLPFTNGYEVARRIKAVSPQMPILMLTAKNRPADRVKGLEIGADDYLPKPFHLKELLLRVKGMLKRRTWYQKTLEKRKVFRFGGNEIDFGRLTGKSMKRRIRLTPLEGALLSYLVTHEGQVVSREELLQKVWNLAADVETRTVDNFIRRLRKYFEPDPGRPIYIHNIRGAGYVFSSTPTDIPPPG